MQIQHKIGADIIFAFDELTTLVNTRGYQEESVVRTQAWAVRCLTEHRRLTAERPERPSQALFGVVQARSTKICAVRHPEIWRASSTATGAASTATGSVERWRSRTWLDRRLVC